MGIWMYFTGYAEFTVDCNNPEAIINFLREELYIKSISKTKEGYLKFVCFLKDAKNVVNNIADKKAKMIGVKYGGLPYFLYGYRKRLGLVVGIVLVLFLTAISSLFVWEIRVEGNESISHEEVVKVLNEVGFREGIRKSSVDIQSTVNKFLIKERRVSWLMINFDGTVAHVELKEARIPASEEKGKNINIVASHDGVILRADALQGGCQVESGQTVTKGQLLISAFTDRKDGKVSLRGARGFVWANTQRRFYVSIPLEYCEKKYTGKFFKTYRISFLGSEFVLPLCLKPLTGTFERIESSPGNNLTNTSIPVKILADNYREYITVTCRRTVKNALMLSEMVAWEQLMSQNNRFTEISRKSEYEVRDGCLCAVWYFDGVENIAQELEFSLS